METNYQILEGVEISREELKLPKARKLALGIQNNPFCVDGIKFIKRRFDNAEILFFIVDVEISQRSLNGIEAYEEIALICHEADDRFPEVYAVRPSFKTGLPHTNAQTFAHPISLCITEQLYDEVMHRFNEYEYINSIRNWLSLTSKNQLHQEDQPLEPFFIPQGFVIIPKDYSPTESTFLNRCGNSNTLYISNEPNGFTEYILIGFETDAQIHGFVRMQPTKMSDLADVVLKNSKPFPLFLKEYIDTHLLKLLDNKAMINKSLAFFFKTPVKRNAGDIEASSFHSMFFFTELSLLQIGEKSNLLVVENGTVVPVLGKSINQEVIDNITVEYYAPLNDFSPEFASIYNNVPFNEFKYAMIGCGALGSQVLDLFARLGHGKFIVFDHDNLYPHNLSKHSLSREDIGFNKAIKATERVNKLLNCNYATPINANVLKLEKNALIEMLSDTKNIIDISTSIAVARFLARDLGEKIKTPRTTCFLNPKGTDLVILAEDSKRMHRLDFLEMQYYRELYNEPLLHNHLNYEETLKVRYNRNSCREITNRVNQIDVSLFSSVCAKSLLDLFERKHATISIYQSNSSFEIKHFEFIPSKWHRKNIGNWRIYTDDWLIQKIRIQRLEKIPFETGGILIGSIDTQRQIIYMCDTISAPLDSIATIESFERGREGLLEDYKRYQRITDSQFQYIGEWHSHPEGSPTTPSKNDIDLYNYLFTQMSKQGLPIVEGIIGDNEIRLIFKNPENEF